MCKNGKHLLGACQSRIFWSWTETGGLIKQVNNSWGGKKVISDLICWRAVLKWKCLEQMAGLVGRDGINYAISFLQPDAIPFSWHSFTLMAVREQLMEWEFHKVEFSPQWNWESFSLICNKKKNTHKRKNKTKHDSLRHCATGRV